MKTVYFVRHAQPNYENHVDVLRELTAKGQADTALVTGFLQDKKVGLVLSSPYRRAVDTVSPFAQKQGLAVKLIDGFRERKVGEGWIEDFDSFAKKQWEDFSYKLPTGECLSEVQQRNLQALLGVFQQYPRESVIAIGSHGTALSTVINAYQPAFGYEEFLALAKMPWIVEFQFEDNICGGITSYDLFTGTETWLL